MGYGRFRATTPKDDGEEILDEYWQDVAPYVQTLRSMYGDDGRGWFDDLIKTIEEGAGSGV